MSSSGYVQRLGVRLPSNVDPNWRVELKDARDPDTIGIHVGPYLLEGLDDRRPLCSFQAYNVLPDGSPQGIQNAVIPVTRCMFSPEDKEPENRLITMPDVKRMVEEMVAEHFRAAYFHRKLPLGDMWFVALRRTLPERGRIVTYFPEVEIRSA